MDILHDISQNLQQGRAKAVRELVQQAIDSGLDSERILNEGLLAGMSVIGRKFKADEIYVPDVLIASRAMNMGAEVLKPLLMKNGTKARGKVILGTVRGDMHDIGKNLVKMMMEGKGLEVVDLGTDVPGERFIDEAVSSGARVIALSALLTTTLGEMKQIVDLAFARGIRDKIKIMIGGAPVTEEFRRSIGADYYAADAATASEIALSVFE
ncbi:MAG: cobalamin-dependent protein [Eubacteriales bacterium]|nr:cobalamin-dependent protein [Eubacteriales bacterium]